MPEALSPEILSSSRDRTVIVDVRKRAARIASGETIAGAVYGPPFSADLWWADFKGDKVVVFCAHGHEVSRAVCGFLTDCGIEARYLEGGFAAWKAAGLPVATIAQG